MPSRGWGGIVDFDRYISGSSAFSGVQADWMFSNSPLNYGKLPPSRLPALSYSGRGICGPGFPLL